MREKNYCQDNATINFGCRIGSTQPEKTVVQLDRYIGQNRHLIIPMTINRQTIISEDDYQYSQESSSSRKDKHKSLRDNFTTNFESELNTDTEGDMTTYSVTSQKDSDVYRITVYTDNVNITNSLKRKEYEIKYLQECAKYLIENSISYESTNYKNKNAVINRMQVISYGENIFFGEKAYVRSITFFNGNKNFTIGVTSKKNSYDKLFDEFIETFEFIY